MDNPKNMQNLKSATFCKKSQKSESFWMCCWTSQDVKLIFSYRYVKKLSIRSKNANFLGFQKSDIFLLNLENCKIRNLIHGHYKEMDICPSCSLVYKEFNINFWDRSGKNSGYGNENAYREFDIFCIFTRFRENRPFPKDCLGAL